jgi:hypothetical protein
VIRIRTGETDEAAVWLLFRLVQILSATENLSKLQADWVQQPPK